MDPNQIKARDYEIDVLPQVVWSNPLNQVIYQRQNRQSVREDGKDDLASSHELKLQKN